MTQVRLTLDQVECDFYKSSSLRTWVLKGGAMAKSNSGDNTRQRGFASMDSEKQKEIARKGGKAAHEKGTAHQFTSEEARAAGKKGGVAVSRNREHMSLIGQIGGQNSAGGRRQRQSNSQEKQGESEQPVVSAFTQSPQYQQPAIGSLT